MHGTYLIEVARKPGLGDPLGTEIAEEIKELGIGAACKVATSKLYRLVGQLTADERARIGTDLLSDPVVEEVREGGWIPEKPGKSIVVDVWYKPGVTDTVGESVLKGLRDLNLDAIHDVRTGTRYRFTGLRDQKAVEKVTLAALINPLIHDRTIHAD